MTLKITKNGVEYTVFYDKADHSIVSKSSWCISFMRSGKPRVEARISGKLVRMHRLISGANNQKQKVDHINGNTLDNRRVNLRVCTNTENSRNRGRNSNNKSGFKGVFKKRDKWTAQIKHNSKSIYLGVFSTPEEAHEAYKKAADQLHGEFKNYG